MRKVMIFLFCLFTQVLYAFDEKKSDVQELVKLKVEVAGMTAQDQAIRFAIMDVQKKYGSNYLKEHPELVKYWQDIDEFNSKKVEKILLKWGWLGAAKVGAKCNQDLWLLIQHSDKNVTLQEKALSSIKKSSNNKNELSQYAYLYDRVQVNKHLPQRYGTQGICKKAHDWQPYKIEDLKNINQRRREVGLGSFQEYQQIVKQLCY